MDPVGVVKVGWNSFLFSLFLPGAARQILILSMPVLLHRWRQQEIRMAPIEKKRHRDLAAFKAKKRQRADHESNNSREGHKAGAVGLDKLPWNEVAVDRLDDAEGFFGLEELSDVDVVRDSMLGKVEYKVCKESLHNSFCHVLTA